LDSVVYVIDTTEDVVIGVVATDVVDTGGRVEVVTRDVSVENVVGCVNIELVAVAVTVVTASPELVGAAPLSWNTLR
jgi:hypothetical protein